MSPAQLTLYIMSSHLRWSCLHEWCRECRGEGWTCVPSTESISNCKRNAQWQHVFLLWSRLQEKQLSSLKVVFAGSWYKERTLQRLSRPVKLQPSWQTTVELENMQPSWRIAPELTYDRLDISQPSWQLAASLTNKCQEQKTDELTDCSRAHRLQNRRPITAQLTACNWDDKVHRR